MSSSQTYALWAHEVFKSRIEPELNAADRHLLLDFHCSHWMSVCGPGEGVCRFRLFPGALLLLWAEALGGHGASEGAEPVAAALELLHNASLVHDDVLDGHDQRRGQPTLRQTRGISFAVLAGDGLVSTAMRLLARVDKDHLPGVLSRLGKAQELLVAGQMSDEPEYWSQVRPQDRERHWHSVCGGKLALGNVSASLGAFWAGRTDLEKIARGIMDEFSEVSQIINDFGDLFQFAGYHEITASGRNPGEEARRKPTLPKIWSMVPGFEQGNVWDTLYDGAQREIEDRRCRAITRISTMALQSKGAAALLRSFFEKPNLPPRGPNDPKIV
jgi:geranylgeranyl diphosphate synthase type I